MKLMPIYKVLIASIACCSCQAFAQQSTCDAILASGIRDFVGKTTELNSRSEFMDGLCSSDESVRENTRGRAASGRYGSFGAKAGETKTSFEALRQARCGSSQSLSGVQLNESDVSNLANASVVNAWVACKQLERTNRVTMKYDALGDGFSVGLAYTATGEPSKVQSYVISPANAIEDIRCQGALSVSKEESPVSLSSNIKYLDCTRLENVNEAFEVVVRTDIDSYRFSYDGQPPKEVRSTEAAELHGKMSVLQAQLNSAVPTGTVLAFDLDACPEGWGYIPDLAGRTIIGSGSANEGVSERVRGDKGGEEMHTLTVDEMPSHSHGSGWLGGGSITPATVQPTSRFPDNLPTAKGTQISSSGGSKPHNNMPPFLVLTYCKKL